MPRKVAMDNAEQRSLRITFLVVSGALGGLAYKLYPSIMSYVCVTAAFMVLFASLFRPSMLWPLYTVWLKISRAVGKCNTAMVLGLIYYLLIFPAGYMLRLVGKDAMKRKNSHAESYWEDCALSGLGDKSRYERQF
jgi:hypothetical protein